MPNTKILLLVHSTNSKGETSLRLGVQVAVDKLQRYQNDLLEKNPESKFRVSDPFHSFPVEVGATQTEVRDFFVNHRGYTPKSSHPHILYTADKRYRVKLNKLAWRHEKSWRSSVDNKLNWTRVGGGYYGKTYTMTLTSLPPEVTTPTDMPADTQLPTPEHPVTFIAAIR